MDNTLTWGGWVARRRSLLGLTQQDLAVAINCSRSWLHKLENHLRQPSAEVAELLATQLKLHPRYHHLFIDVARGTQPASSLPLPEYAQQTSSRTQRLPLVPPPPVFNALIGRTAELQLVVTQLTQPTTRLLTISGTGGVGKTRLALELVSQLSTHFFDGVIWIDLTRVRSTNLVPLLVAHALQLPQTHPDNIWAQIIQMLQQRTCLLILDNAEHLLPDLTHIIQHLLTDTAELTILVTSRRALNLPQEHIDALQPFDVSQLHSASVADQLVYHPAVALFLERMHQRGGTPALDNHNVQAIAEICRMLDGIPLALELAAARTRVLPPSMLREQLASHLLPLLQQHGPNRPQRQQTLALTIDWSYQLVPSAAQALFEQLGFFISAIDLATIHAVCTPDSTLEDLQQQLDLLVEAHLITRINPENHSLVYAMFETVRSFAYERIKDTPTYNTLARSYSSYVINSIKSATHQVKSGTIHTSVPSFLKLQHPHIQNSLSYLLQHYPDDAVQIYIVIGLFWQTYGYWNETIQWYKQITTQIQLAPYEHIKVHHIYASGLNLLNQTEQAIQVLEQSLALAQEHHYDDLKPRLLHVLGHSCLAMNRLQEASSYYELFRKSIPQNDHANLIHALSNFAHVERVSKKYQAALDLYSEALALAQHHNHQILMCWCSTNKAATLIDNDNVAQALPLLNEALLLAETIQARAIHEYILLERGRAAALQGYFSAAQHDLKRTLGMGKSSGNKSNICEALEYLACVFAKTNQFQQSVQLYETALALRQQWQTPRLYANVLVDQLNALLDHNVPASLRHQWHAEAATLTLAEVIDLALSL